MKLVCFVILTLKLTSWHVAVNGQVKPPEDIFKYKPLDSYVELSGGEFLMGINDRDGFNFEHPQRKGIVKAMRVMLYPVSLASFKRYKQQKYRHRTDAELAGQSWVFKQVLNENAVLVNDEIDYSNDSDAQESIRNEMVLVRDARWNRPEGGSSLINEKLEYPVVHVSFSDARAYCAWKGMRLPNEIEWEYAARGGLNEKVYPWGDYWEIRRTNLWQGKFPDENQLRDDYFGLSPVNAFQAQNKYEMYDVIGNVWEWTTTLFRNVTDKSEINPTRRCLKGGSFLDARDGDYRTDSKQKIRISSRIGRNEKFTAYNVGFRCVQTIDDAELEYFLKGLDGKQYRIVKLRPPILHRNEAVNTETSDDNEDLTKRKILYNSEL